MGQLHARQPYYFAATTSLFPTHYRFHAPAALYWLFGLHLWNNVAADRRGTTGLAWLVHYGVLIQLCLSCRRLQELRTSGSFSNHILTDLGPE